MIGRRTLLAALPAALPVHRAAAQEFPSRRVTIVVPYPPGGTTDAMARMLAQRITGPLGQPVVVENRAGANTVIAAEHVARAEPDGHTILVSSGTTHTLNPLLNRSLPYKPEDFAPVALVSRVPLTLLARKDLPGTLPEFTAWAKSRGAAVNAGTNGPTSIHHLTVLMLNQALGLSLQGVPYRGDSQQIVDLLAGRIDLAVVGGGTSIAAHRNDQGRILAFTGGQRLPSLPDVPTLSESTPDLLAQTWFGLMVPARTPRPAIDRLNQVVVAALGDAELRQRLEADGQFVSGPTTPEQVSTFLREDAERWAPIVRGIERRPE
ncbi:Bug family tripartite tricarboxylate transporter substrate binding protein [Sabulicella glaciei]|uniref:Tripartite tricarboxylate transporter substrate binding protein n=1 Tax=Sabulicella glaciei TaxID=2984948 RepID=A0ABT3NPU4_9PROT|nr:tripartite tricarboxylate transporter substrate binding protein [Roseococcus sp. MDT2-1-1]MCW8084184.1 tripartite tricarboxylate transporter substrate binding protein [Roseococcus sp. MDT2-1-1]